ncbi:30S ribosomal protein S14 [Candidatus Chromulinivorax destructor]|uniref:Small ribosomal subunit protein uS14 n=1 Tax=Candidatus Chromulinivorax destructor TaxID=2066483 RepID=A0A345ZAY8_9BACT|nr:30S ribosomal protein S14 [Candidatus Chromulinivorax destructor]AXK60455.1 30S ribosomal protein S14 [Candidatus Chromulinivorax destructor]
MAKKSSVEKNKKRIRMVEQYKDRRLALKKATVDLSLTLEERMAAQAKLSDLPKNSSAVRVRNRCSQTGRPRGFLRFFGVSRIVFRDLASAGLLPGVRKASW